MAAFASLAVARGQGERAVRLFAVAAAFYRALGVQVPPKLRPDWAGAISRAREMIGDDRFAATWAMGRALTIEDAIADTPRAGGGGQSPMGGNGTAAGARPAAGDVLSAVPA